MPDEQRHDRDQCAAASYWSLARLPASRPASASSMSRDLADASSTAWSASGGDLGLVDRPPAGVVAGAGPAAPSFVLAASTYWS